MTCRAVSDMRLSGKEPFRPRPASASVVTRGDAAHAGAHDARPVAAAGVAALPTRQHGRAAQRRLQLLQRPTCGTRLPVMRSTGCPPYLQLL